MSDTDFLWVEKYRPPTINDCILPDNLKNPFLDIIAKGEIPNMILSGTAGCGKTTAALALFNEMGYDHLFINGSLNGNIDTLRNQIQHYASSVSLTGMPKVVFIDEADYLNPQSTQPALRGFIEEFHSNCRFVMTCNFKNKIIDPLHSRCTVIDFAIPPKSKPALAKQFMERAKWILDSENVKYNDKVLVELILKRFPDYRKILGELQIYSASGQIDEGILVNLNETKVASLMKSMAAKDFKVVRKWVVDNLDNDPVQLFRGIYDYINANIPQIAPQAVIILGEYQYKNAFVADTEINFMACLTELMCECDFN